MILTNTQQIKTTTLQLIRILRINKLQKSFSKESSKQTESKSSKHLKASEDRYWKLLGRQVASKRVKHQSIEFEQYKFKEDDRKGYYKEIIELIEKKDYQPLTESPQYLVDYAISKKNGHQFMRACLTQKYQKDSIYFVSIKWVEIFLLVIDKDNETQGFISKG